MKTHTVTDLSNDHLVRVTSYSSDLSQKTCYVTIIQEAFSDESVYYPAQSISLGPDAVKKLKAVLNSIPE